jgi:hypothetical protein
MAGEEGYAFSLTTFSPSGKLLQIEHALKAVQGGKASLGIQGAQRKPGRARCLQRLLTTPAAAHSLPTCTHSRTPRCSPALQPRMA